MNDKVQRISAKRILLLYLYENPYPDDAAEVYSGLTQLGIANELSMQRGYVSYLLNLLIKGGLCEQRLAHVKGRRRKVNVYTLTWEGCIEGKKLEGIVERIEIFHKKSGEVEKNSVGKLSKLYNTRLAKIMAGTSEEGLYDPNVRVMTCEGAELRPDFVGREEELRIAREWGESGHGLIYVHGLAGEGKTALLHRMSEIWSERGLKVLYHRIEGSDPELSLYRAIALFMKENGNGNLSDLISEKTRINSTEFLASAGSASCSRILVAVDDLHRVEDASLREELFKVLLSLSRIGIKVAVSSRDRCPVRDPRIGILSKEVLEIHLKGLDEGSCRSFLMNGGIDDWHPVFELTRGHPLFLQLIRNRSSSEREIESKYSVVEFIGSEVLAGLSEGEKDALSFVSLFKLDPTCQELMDLDMGDRYFSMGDIDSLIEKCILERKGHNVHVHDLVGDIVRSRLTRSEREFGHKVLARHYQEVLEIEYADNTGIERITRRIADLKCFFYHLTRTSPKIEEIFEAVSDHGDDLILFSELDPILELTDKHIEKLTRSGVELDPEVLCRTLLINGWCHFVRGRHEVALSRYDSALRISSERDDMKDLKARCVNAKGTIHLNKGEYSQARDLIKSSIDHLRRPQDMAKAWSNLSVLDWREGRLDDALHCADTAILISRRSQDKAGVARGVINKGIILWQKGCLDEALDSYHEALGICEDNRFLQMTAMVHDNIGELMKTRDDILSARRHFTESIRIAESIGFCAQVGESMRNLALLEPDPVRRKDLLNRSLQAFEMAGSPMEASRTQDLIQNV